MTDSGDTGDVPDGDLSRTEGPNQTVALSTAEAARIAGVSARTIRRWVEKGALPAVAGPSGALYVVAQDLEAARIASGNRPSLGRRTRRDTGDMSASRTVRDSLKEQLTSRTQAARGRPVSRGEPRRQWRLVVIQHLCVRRAVQPLLQGLRDPGGGTHRGREPHLPSTRRGLGYQPAPASPKRLNHALCVCEWRRTPGDPKNVPGVPLSEAIGARGRTLMRSCLSRSVLPQCSKLTRETQDRER